jgi:hypothetical protein
MYKYYFYGILIFLEILYLKILGGLPRLFGDSLTEEDMQMAADQTLARYSDKEVSPMLGALYKYQRDMPYII